jgi:hypothetical protein
VNGIDVQFERLAQAAVQQGGHASDCGDSVCQERGVIAEFEVPK